MKLKNLFITLGLSLAMVLGVGVSLNNRETSKIAKADEITLRKYYFNASSLTNNWWHNDGAATYMYAYSSTIKVGDQQLSNAAWPGQQMTKDPQYGIDAYYLEVDERLDKAIFLRVNPNNTSEIWTRTSKDGGVDINLPNSGNYIPEFTLNYNFTDAYDDANYAGVWRQLIYEVNTHYKDINGVNHDGHQTLRRGHSPTEPTIGFGEYFQGWYADENYRDWFYADSEQIYTEPVDVYGYVREAELYTYTYDFTNLGAALSLANKQVRIHQYNSLDTDDQFFTISNTYTGTFTVPEYCTLSIEGLQQYYQDIAIHNSAWTSWYKNDVLIIVIRPGNNEYNLCFRTDDDIPPTEGYYLVDANNNVRFDNVHHDDASTQSYYKMEQFATPDANGYIAVYRGHQTKYEERLLIRSYFNGKDRFYGKDDENYFFDEVNQYNYYSHYDNDTFEYIKYYYVRFDRAGTFDIYLHQNGTYHVVPTSGIVGYVNYSVFAPEFKGVLDREGFILEEDEIFNPSIPSSVYQESLDLSILPTGELFTDEQCTIPYTPRVIENGETIYAKAYLEGAYLVGDATFSGGADKAWKLEGSIGFTFTSFTGEWDEDDDNIYRNHISMFADVNIPVTTTPSNPITVGTLALVSMYGGYQGYLDNPLHPDFTLDHAYNYANLVQNEGDFCKLAFTRGGQYTISSTVELVFHYGEGNPRPTERLDIIVNVSLSQEDDSRENFIDNFLTAIGGICQNDGSTNITNLQNEWAIQKGIFNALDEADRNVIKAIGFSGGNENGNNLEKMIAKYAYIITKYGTNTFEDFIFGQELNARNTISLANNSNVPIIVIAALSMTSLLVVFGIKAFSLKRKED